MFCKNCGSRLDDNAVACPHCGVATDNFYINRKAAPARNDVPGNDAPSGGFAVLCFFFPVAGLILYLVWRKSKPKRAKSCGKGAIVGLTVLIILIIAF